MTDPTDATRLAAIRERQNQGFCYQRTMASNDPIDLLGQFSEDVAYLLALVTQLQQENAQWREWVQFVWRDAGDPVGTNQELQAHICAQYGD